MKKIILIPLLILLILHSPLTAHEEPSRADQIKVGFIHSFCLFTKWPEDSGMEDQNIPFIIGVLGDTPIGQLLESKTFSDRRIKGKKPTIRLIEYLSEIDDCHILFIANSYKEEIDKIIAITRDKPILTISDTEGFCKAGVHINFLRVQNKIRFEINATALLESGLKMNPKVFRVAVNIIEPIKVEQK